MAAVLLTFGVEARADDVFGASGFAPNRDYFTQLPYEHIDPLTGNLILTFTDLVLPGNAGFDLRIQRTYNSKIYRNYETTSDAPEEDTWAGLGWTLHMGRVLNPYFTYSAPPVIEMPDGSRHATFGNIADGRSTFVTREFWVYDRNTNTLSLPNGTVYTFGHAGTTPNGNTPITALYATQIKDVFGNEIDVDYATGGAPEDALATITQHVGGETRQVTFTYDDIYKSIATMTYVGQQTHTWTYTPQGTNTAGYSLLSSVTPPAGPPWTYTYNTNKAPRYELASLTTPNGGKISYAYEDHLFHLGTTVGVRQRVVASRTTSGRQVPAGTWTYTYPTTGNQSAVTGPCTTTTYTFLGVGNYSTIGSVWKIGLMSGKAVSDASGTLESESIQWEPSVPISSDSQDVGFNHDPAIYVPLTESSTVTRAGQNYSTTNTYSPSNFNDYGRPYQIDEAGQLSRTTTRAFQYGFTPYIVDRIASETVAVNSESFARGFTYDPYTGFIQTKTVYGITTTFSPDQSGNVASSTDANSHTTIYTYDWGVLKDTVPPLSGAAIFRAIDPEGTVASETRNGFTTSYQYDGLFRVTQRTPPFGNPINTSYDVNNNNVWVSATVKRGPSKTISTLDGFGRTIGTQNSVGILTQTTYDACGRKTYQSYPYNPNAAANQGGGTANVGTGFQYDGLDRLTLKTNTADSTSARYDYSGIDVDITDENNHTTHQDWSAFGNPGDARLVSVRDARFNTTSYQYNALGNLTKVSSNGSPDRTWHYNASNLLDQETHPEAGTVTYSYYPAGNLYTRTDSQFGMTTFSYDANTRLTGIDRPGSAYDTTIQYDNADNRALLQNSNVSSTFTYDGVNRIKSRTDVVNGQSFLTTYNTYDGNDNLKKLTYPSGQRVTYDYDSENRVQGVGTPANAVAYAGEIVYHSSGAMASYTAGNGLVEAVAFDPRYRIRNLNSGAPSSAAAGLLDLTYGYDSVGNIKTITDARPNMSVGASSPLGYDELDRLTSASGYWGNGTLDYDTVGNRKSNTLGGSFGYTYDFTTQHLTSVSTGETFTYDANGNTKTDSTEKYSYTPDNMLETATATAGGNVTTYRYDGDDLRALKFGGGVDTYYIHGPGNQILTELDEVSGSTTLQSSRDYVYAGSRLIASVQPPTFAAAPKSLVFVAVLGDTTTPWQPVSLTYRPGTATASWQAKVKGNALWIRFDPNPPSGTVSGTASSGLSISADPSGLGLGTYSDTVQVTAPNALGNPQQIGVTLIVVSSAMLTSLPSQLTFQGFANGSPQPTQTVTVVYPRGSVPWEAAGTQPWLSVTPPSGSTPSAFSISVNTAGLGVGTYTDTITVTSADTPGSPALIPVVLTLQPPPGETCAAGAWYCEPFDELAYGDLNGQGGWNVVGQAGQNATAQVDGDPRGVGSLSVFDAPAGGNEKDQVNLGGHHLADGTEISLQVMETGAKPKGKHISKIEFFTDSGYFGKTGRTYGALRIGGGLELQYGANIGVDLLDGGMESGRFYEVLVQYYHGYVFAYVDGVLKFTTSSGLTPDMPVKALATTSWDYPGYVNMDILQARPTPPLPILLADPPSLALSAPEDGSATGSLAVSGLNIPSGPTWQATVDQAWLAIAPSTGSGPGAITLTVASGALSPGGTYVANVTLTSPDALNSPVVVPVTVTVAARRLTTTPTSLGFLEAVSGLSSQGLTIGGAAVVAGSTWRVSADQTWLTLDVTEGTGPGVVNVTANATGLARGAYAGNVIVTTSDASGDVSVTVPVTLTISNLLVVFPGEVDVTLRQSKEGPVLCDSSFAQAAATSASAAASSTSAVAPRPAIGLARSLPLAFEPNLGQADRSVRFVARGSGFTLGLNDGEIEITRFGKAGGVGAAVHQRFAAKPPRPKATVRMHFDGGRAKAKPVSEGRLPGKSHYFRGSDPKKWVRNVPQFSRVLYRNVYPGIDVVYYGKAGSLEYDLVAAPGADLSKVALTFDGATSLTVNDSGDLIVGTAAGPIVQKKPRIYQRDGTEERPVAGRYTPRAGNRIGFDVPEFDPKRPLVIDPQLLLVADQAGTDDVLATAVDSSGNLLLTGIAIGADIGSECHKSSFVEKLTPDASAVVFTSYIAGGCHDGGKAVSSDATGVYVAGDSDSMFFPLVNASFGPTRPSYMGSAFVAKLDPTGSTILFSAILGGSGGEDVSGAALDSAGNLWVTGLTSSPDFPLLNPLQSELPEGENGESFVTKVRADGTLAYSTFFGGTSPTASSSSTTSTGIAVDPAGNAYIVGRVATDDFPVVNPPASAASTGPGFFAEFDPLGGLVYSAYLDEPPGAVALDHTGASLYLAGPAASFPSGDPLYVTRMDSSGATVSYTTSLGGSDGALYGLAVDGAGNALVTGWPSADLTLVNPLDTPSKGAFLAELDPAGQVIYATLQPASLASKWVDGLGPTGQAPPVALTVDGEGNAVLIGPNSDVDYVQIEKIGLGTSGTASGYFMYSPASFVSRSASSVELTVGRTGDASLPGTASFATADGTAVQGEDYVRSSGTLPFAAGQGVNTFGVPPIPLPVDVMSGDLVFTASVAPAGDNEGTTAITICNNKLVLEPTIPLSAAPTTSWYLSTDANWLKVGPYAASGSKAVGLWIDAGVVGRRGEHPLCEFPPPASYRGHIDVHIGSQLAGTITVLLTTVPYP